MRMVPTSRELTTERTAAKPRLSLRAQLAHLGRDVAERGVLPVELREQVERRGHVARRLVRGGQVVAQALVFLVGAAGRAQALLEPLDRQLGHALLEEADAEHAGALEYPALVFRRQLELGDRLVDEPHLLVGDAEVVARVVVLLAQLFVDALLELLEYVGEPHVAQIGGSHLRRRLLDRRLSREALAQLGFEIRAAGLAPVGRLRLGYERLRWRWLRRFERRESRLATRLRRQRFCRWRRLGWRRRLLQRRWQRFVLEIEGRGRWLELGGG